MTLRIGIGASVRNYPPHQDAVFEAFLKLLNEKRRTSYVITQRPDESERRETEIDYVATDSRFNSEIAVEVSSIWRSSAAGKEDSDWGRFTQRVQELSSGRVPGRFHVYTDMRIPPGLDVQTFSDELIQLIARDDSKLSLLSKQGRGLNLHLSWMDVFVSKSVIKASDVSFGRKGEDSMTRDFPNFVREILSKKSPKLRRHKERGRETWLVVYNTIWPLMSPFDSQKVVEEQLGPEHAHIDHLCIVAGNPPDDAWLIEIR